MNPKWFLGGVLVLFLGLLAAVWVLSHRAHPVLLDERGRPVSTSSHHH